MRLRGSAVIVGSVGPAAARMVAGMRYPDRAPYVKAVRMAEAGISNMGAYMRKMALNGYVLHVDLSDIRELVALQRRCANNLNQVAVHANTYGIYPSEIAALQKDYADLWEPLSELLKKLSAVVSL